MCLVHSHGSFRSLFDFRGLQLLFKSIANWLDADFDKNNICRFCVLSVSESDDSLLSRCAEENGLSKIQYLIEEEPKNVRCPLSLSLIHISEPTRPY